MNAIKTKSIILSILLFYVFACGMQRGDSYQRKQFRINQSIVVDGLSRTYLVNLPPNYYESSSFPLVIALHGGGGSGVNFEFSTGLTDKANSENFIIVYPNGYLGPGKKRTWNAGYCCGAAKAQDINDVKFISSLIDKLSSEFKINTQKIYITGHSNGGMMGYRIASELSNKIAAIAVNSCSMVVKSPINPYRAVPVLHMHSILDVNIPFNGGIGVNGRYFPPVDSILNIWANINACNAIPQIKYYTGYSYKAWIDCSPNLSVQLYLTNDGGHSWPQGNKVNPNADPTSKVINANDLLWNFFKQFQSP